MPFSKKRFAMLALLASMAPLAAQAQNSDPRLIRQTDITQTSDCWAANFGFLPAHCNPAVCTAAQKGGWPRLHDCVR